MINWIIGGVIFVTALLIIIKRVIKSYKGEGCCGCEGCSSDNHKCSM